MGEDTRLHTTPLTPTSVLMAKNKAGTVMRKGYADPNGQVFLPPKTGSEETWKKKMEQKGYSF